MEKLISKIEAILYVYGEPMEYKKLAQILKKDESEVMEAAGALRKNLESAERGLSLVESGGKIQLVTKPEFSGIMEEIVKEELHEALTPAALETLAIVTYAGPLSRAELEYIRGVNSSFTLRNLLIRGLIERDLDPNRGNVFLYRPSMNLVKHLGISSAADLPEYAKFRELIEKLRQPADGSK